MSSVPKRESNFDGDAAILSLINDEVLAPALILDEKGFILDANIAFCVMINYRPPEVAGQTWVGLADPDCQAQDSLHLRRLCATGQVGPWRTQLRNCDGASVPVLVRATRLGERREGLAGRFLFLVFDASEFEESEQELRNLAGKLLKLYDEERRRIARELHDTTAQNLAALSMNLAMLAPARTSPGRDAEIIAECSSLTEECLKEVRSLSYMLHPPLLDELGLESALRTFIALYERRTGVAVTLDLNAPLGRLDPEVELGAFRIAQESLFNVQRHSGSVRAEVRLSRLNAAFEVEVRDWGVGITGEAARGDGLGIAGMRERVRLLGGQLEIQPAEPGTLVRAIFPTD